MQKQGKQPSAIPAGWRSKILFLHFFLDKATHMSHNKKTETKNSMTDTERRTE
jgi:hypothetical protein